MCHTDASIDTKNPGSFGGALGELKAFRLPIVGITGGESQQTNPSRAIDRAGALYPDEPTVAIRRASTLQWHSLEATSSIGRTR